MEDNETEESSSATYRTNEVSGGEIEGLLAWPQGQGGQRQRDAKHTAFVDLLCREQKALPLAN